MPALQPRISTVVEPPLFATVERLARRDHMSVSQKARDLLRQAVDLDEDADLAAVARQRKSRRGPLLSHGEIWKKASKKGM